MLGFCCVVLPLFSVLYISALLYRGWLSIWVSFHLSLPFNNFLTKPRLFLSAQLLVTILCHELWLILKNVNFNRDALDFSRDFLLTNLES